MVTKMDECKIALLFERLFLPSKYLLSMIFLV